MHSLTEIIAYANPEYIQYFSKKTGFLLNPGNLDNQKTRWLWQHIVRTYNFKSQFESLTAPEKKSLQTILMQFGFQINTQPELFNLEAKIPWIFKHPAGGIFVPLEILKLLMQEEFFQKEYYLFGLLYKLKIKEQKYMASLTGNDLEGQTTISFEKNTLDMSLVLYIWIASKIQNTIEVESVLPNKGKILRPYAFTREGEGELKKTETSVQNQLESVFPAKPANLWDYLLQNFSHLNEDTEKLHKLLSQGRKGFYRSLAIINNPNNEYIKLFKKGFLFPLLQANFNTPDKVNKIKVVSPAEFLYHFQQNNSKERKEKK